MGASAGEPCSQIEAQINDENHQKRTTRNIQEREGRGVVNLRRRIGNV